MMIPRPQPRRELTLAALLLLAVLPADASNPGTPWPATDALGRKLPTAEAAGPPQTNRFVGIFYFQWLVPEMPIPKSQNWDGPYDIGRILARDPDALKQPDSPLWGRIGEYHFWSEPLYGYYRSADPWVIRRHAQLLADAGVAGGLRVEGLPTADLAGLIQELTEQMHTAAAELHFELAARLRDEVSELKKELRQMTEATR